MTLQDFNNYECVNNQCHNTVTGSTMSYDEYNTMWLGYKSLTEGVITHNYDYAQASEFLGLGAAVFFSIYLAGKMILPVIEFLDFFNKRR